MSSSADDDYVILSCTNPNPIEHEETLISTRDIRSWDLSNLLRCQTLHIQAHRNTLVEQSSYFQGLFGGSFSESNLCCVSVQWNLEILVNVLNCIYGLEVNAALYFGVETLLAKCKNWFSKVASAERSEQQEIQLDDLIHIWNFGLEHANDFVPELCASYLAKKFYVAMSDKNFGNVPYDLLLRCIKHPNLTLYSEMHLSDTILVWLNAKSEQLELSSNVEDDCIDILKQIRISLLPLWFVAGKRRSIYFSELANESIEAIFKLMKIPSTSIVNALGNGDLDPLKIRLTRHSNKVDLAGCPQITSGVLLLSLLPSLDTGDLILRKQIKHCLIKLEDSSINRRGMSLGSLPTLSFEAVEEVDISNCPKLHLEAAIECFSKSFPSLRKIKAAYLLNIRTLTFRKLVQNCPLISEVDLTLDITPLLPAQVSVLSSSFALKTQDNKFASVGSNYLDMTSCYSGPSLSNISRLTLEGHSDICDLELQLISELCVSLQYLNIKGCISVSDVGISNVIGRCIKLHSILVCDTSFGVKSILALCSPIKSLCASMAHCGKMCSDTLAYNLQMLHMGGCKGVDERSLVELMLQTQMLKSLCLRSTHLVNDAFYSFSGSSLEMLDVSNTMISGEALAHIVHGNPTLKCLNVRGCKNLVDNSGTEISSSYLCGQVYAELGKKCSLEEIELGWGFSSFALEALRPAIKSLRAITVGLGGSLGEDALRILPTTCPALETISLYFQVISDSIMMDIIGSLRHLQMLAICYCLGNISISSFKFSSPNLRKLRLERVTPWMTNNDLVILTENFMNLVELSLLGCKLLNSDSLCIISHGWPGLISIHLEECGEVTANGISSLFNCKALEDILLRHNGPGLHRSFILDAASELPMLRHISLDLCDACEGDFDIPDYDDRNFLSTVKIARCKSQRSSLCDEFWETRGRVVHKETLVLVWNSERLTRTVIKERL